MRYMTETTPTRPALGLVGSDLPDPPYPPEIRAEGWRFALETTRIRASDTWTLARPEIRPWLLLLWMTAWDQSPCGTLPVDDTMIAALLGIDSGLYATHRAVLMRGWQRHADGRLYHTVMTEQVLRMIDGRKSSRDRQTKWRERKVAPKGTRLDVNWRCPDALLDWAVDVHHIERQRAVRISLAFRDYWVGVPGARGCKLDWSATWRNWIRKEVGDA